MKTCSVSVLSPLAISLIASAAFLANAPAANVSWSGSANTIYTTGSNWLGGTAPTSSATADTAYFAGTPTANQPFVTVSQSISGLRFTTATGGWTLSGSTSANFTVGAGGISTVGQTSGTNTIDARLAVGTSQTWEVGTGGTLVLNGSLLTAGGQITIGSAGNTGTVVLNPLTTNYIGASGTLTLAYGQLNINNAVALGANPSNFAINGGTILDNTSGGTVTFARAYNQTWNGDFTYAGSNALNTGPGTVSLGTAAGTTRTVTVNGLGSTGLVVAGVISDGSTATGLTKSGTGTLTLSGANAFTGVLSVQRGVLEVGTINNASSVGVLGNSATAVVLGSSGSTGTLRYTGATAASNKAFTLASGGTGAIEVSTAATNLTLSGAIDGAGNLAKTGGGTAILTGSNSYSGTTSVNEGFLRVGSNLALGGTSAGTVVSSGATLQLANGVTVTGESLSLSGPGSDNNGSLQAAAGASAEWAGSITVNSAAPRLGTNDASGVLTVSGAIGGSNGLAISAVTGGTVILSGSNTYTGATTMFRGALKLSGGNNRLPTGTTLVMQPSSGTPVLNLNGNSQTLAGVLTNGASGTLASITNDSGVASTLTTNGSGTSTVFAGQISGNLALTKAGSGTLTLTGSNSYTGATTVSEGTLLISSANNNIAASATIDVASGAVLDVSGVSGFALANGQTLKGTGLIEGALTVGSGATLAIGNSPGTMTFADGLTLDAGSVSNFEINSLTAGFYDLAQGGSGVQAVAFGGTLNLVFQAGFNTLGTIKIFDFESYSGTFTAVNPTGLDGGYSASFNALTGEVTVVPEPSTWALLSLGFGALVLRARSRRRAA